MPKKNATQGPILAVGDLHEPFTRQGYLEFCHDVAKEYRCSGAIFLGDIVDNHAVSFHDHDPDGMSAGDELGKARKSLARWTKAFPGARVCIGNHDARLHRRAFRFGVPSCIIKDLGDIYGTPGWRYDLDHVEGGVLFTHGTGYSGMTAHRRIAQENRQSTVIGHVHCHAGVAYMASPLDLIFGMNVGCGIDLSAYAMAYGKAWRVKPVIGCGVVVSSREAYFVPMNLGDKRS